MCVVCIVIDDCESSPCLNGGSCSNQLNSFHCSCLGGYYGTTCKGM